jgi:hypothetical protein
MSEPTETTEPIAKVSLDDFCRSLSLTDKRIELIAGFHSDEVRAGHLVDEESAFLSRLEAFLIRPVK